MLKSACAICGADYSIADSFCPECGNSLTAEKEVSSKDEQAVREIRLIPCPDCGHQCSPSALSCPNCGRPFHKQVEEKAAPQDSAGLLSPEPSDSRSNKTVAAVGILVGILLIGALSLLLYLFTRPPKQAEIKGEVFIVTKGAQNFKMGLVEVTAIPEESIKKFVEGKLAAINLEFSKYESVKQQTQKQVQEAQQAYDEAKTSYDTLNAKYVAAKSTADKAQEDADEMTTSLSYGSAEDEAALEASTRRANKTKQQAEQLALQLESKRKEVETKEGELSVAKSATTNRLKQVLELLNNEALFKGLPTEGTKTVTNSDGQFLMKLPTNRKYVIAARAQRRVFDSTEEYYWLIWVSLEGEETKQVMLTNKNLMGQDSPDCVFKIKDLIPTGVTEN
jgi:hypothetical protein